MVSGPFVPSTDPAMLTSGAGNGEWLEQAAAECALDGLAEQLTVSGYGEFLACFHPLVLKPLAWRTCRDRVPPALEPVVDLFLLGGRVSPADLPSGLRELLPGLMTLGLMVQEPTGRVRAAGVVVLLVLGNWMICHPPQPDPLFYIGDDSLALLGRLAPGSARSCLDLCAGPGILSLHCARFAPCVTAVERHPRVARLAQLNARLNGVADRVEVLSGDLYQPVAGRRFDLITANPPTLPHPADLPGPRIGHGGDDGLQMTSRVLTGLPDALADRGRAHLVGMALTDGGSGLLRERLAGVAHRSSLHIRCSVLAHVPMRSGGGHFDRLTAAVAAGGGLDRDRVRESYTRLLDRLGASHLSTFFLQVVLGAGGLDLTDVSTPDPAGLWHV